jgi:HlyD family secretion protein
MTGGQLQALIRLICKATGADGAATDVQYLQRFTSQHDQTAFAALVERHAPLVLGVCGRVLSDPNDVEDAFQATFLVLVRKARSIARPHLLANWLYGVAHRTALDAKTRRIRRQARQHQVTDMPAPDATTELIWSDLRPVLDEEVARLPERFRVPFVLCYLEGRTNDEAARLVGCPKGTVLSRLATARERLRTRLTKRGLAPSAALLATLLWSSALRAHASLKLVRGAIEAALTYAGVITVKATIAVEVVSLANGVIKTMFWTKLSHAAGVLLIVGAIGSAGVLTWVPRGSAQDDSRAQVVADDPPKDQAQPTRTEKMKTVVPTEVYTGRTEAVSTTEVRARASGYLDKVAAKQGAEVKKGDVLFEIDPRSYNAEVARAEATLSQCVSRFDRAKLAVDRSRALLNTNSISQEEFEKTAGQRADAEADLRIAQSSFELAKLNRSYTEVRAPASGLIELPPLIVGSLVKANETLLAKIVTMDPVAVAFDVDEKTALRLRRALGPANSWPKSR